jgi:hypothetical protein
MKTQVEFRSSKFPPYGGEQEQINPGLWGKRLAEYSAYRGDAADSLCGSRNQRSSMERADLVTNCRFEKFRAEACREQFNDRSVAAVWNA